MTEQVVPWPDECVQILDAIGDTLGTGNGWHKDGEYFVSFGVLRGHLCKICLYRGIISIYSTQSLAILGKVDIYDPKCFDKLREIVKGKPLPTIWIPDESGNQYVAK